ncbi:hypothetical protein F4780DRAFT_89811 [Xylariomycetidae sp. FL0641]|nr:hypothetical protein F4780DRAFT_89811 [Xylariomycetidae sp. FL0641]
MPITNLVFLTTSAPTLTAATESAMRSALAGQAEWVASQPTSSSSSSSSPRDDDRGVALYQQLENPRVLLETAHWASPAAHAAWLGSGAYGAGSAALAPHFDFGALEYFYVEGALLAPPGAAEVRAGRRGSENDERPVPLLDAPVLSVARVTVPAAEKQAFAAAMRDQDGRAGLAPFAWPYHVRGAWRVRGGDAKEGDEEEFVMFGGWPSVERHMEFGQTEGFAKFAEPAMACASKRDLKHYKRVL